MITIMRSSDSKVDGEGLKRIIDWLRETFGNQGPSIAVFDFDMTLCMHTNPEYRERRKETPVEWWSNALFYPEMFYDMYEPSFAPKSMKCLVWTTQHLAGGGNKVMCLSAMASSLNYKAKEVWLRKHYGQDIELHMTDPPERKVKIMLLLAQMYKCEPSDILFVDDKGETIQAALEAGIVALTPDEVETLYNGINKENT